VEKLGVSEKKKKEKKDKGRGTAKEKGRKIDGRDRKKSSVIFSL
jgi:hypothetical protein